MKYSSALVVALAIITAMALAVGAGAQAPMHNLSGEVLDNDTNDDIGGASLRFENTADNNVEYATTDNWGRYQIMLAEGHYEVRVTADGYEEDVQDFYLGGNQTYEFRLSETGGTGDGDGDGDGNNSGFDPLGEMEQFMWVIYLVGALVITAFVCIIITAIATTATFVRLGKLKKGLKEIDEKLDEMEERDWRRSAPPAVPPVYQQPPAQGQQPPVQ